MIRHFYYFSMFTLLATPLAASAGVYATITPDGDTSDWAAIPVAATDESGEVTGIDFTELKLANDDDNLYILLTFASAVNPQSGSGVFTAVDTDSDSATGFDIFGLGLVGANLGFQNDFPFTMSASSFNTGGTVTGTSYGASPYGTSTLQQEIAIPLATFQTDGSAGGYTGTVFDESFSIMFYSTDSGDVITPASPYTLAVPEPSSLLLAGMGGLAMLRRRRHA